PAGAALPRLSVSVVAGSLDHPWDVAALPHGRLLVTERSRARLSVIRHGHRRTIPLVGSHLWVSGETGLMGLEVDPRWRSNHRIYTCQGWGTSASHDVRVIAWRLTKHLREAVPVRTLVAGLPSTSGRHGGCRLLITRDGSLLIGTGDAATGTNPRNLGSLGGKTLRVNRFTGRPWRHNPFRSSSNAKTRLVYTYGHRNVQGLAQRRDGTLWSIEQGTSRDDEVNRLVAGGDYGYNPVPGYNESVPMTDQSLPGTQIDARWSSGPTTDATSGGTFVPNSRKWKGFRGWLAVAALKNQKLIMLHFSLSGRLLAERTELTGHGRLRTAVVAPNGDLFVTTDNGDGRDVILRVHPR
ncbi:PQQ-dependent sugar dehydrogenase, partial [Nocardioides sp. CER28]